MRPLLVVALLLALAGPAFAQAPQPPAVPSAEEVEALLARMQRQLERMSEAAAERDRALRFLEEQIEAVTGRLSATGQTAESLKQSKAELETKLETLASDREQLQARLQSLEDERERKLRELSSRIEQLTALLGASEQEKTGLGRKLAEAEAARAADGTRLAALEQEVERRGRRIAELEARLGELEKGLGEREARLAASAADIDRLNRLLGVTTSELQRVAKALESSQAEVDTQKLVIADLGARLNAALLQQVEQLEQYRSEFFGRLRRILADRPDVVIVGDRFVFPSELLFPTGSARLEPEGEAQLERLAATLREVAATIPSDIDWVLRIDGHTDRRPVGPGSPFRSNWELSTARAISVVEFLIRRGIPPERLVAAGFGEFRPLDPGDGETAWRRNRRIEFKLTER
ncbi:MAG: peptidoglycan -binding protein [Geminicoccaceae bacterium]|nr:peptidoglycan -binding protein [Geminicoccaceae bacterium]